MRSHERIVSADCERLTEKAVRCTVNCSPLVYVSARGGADRIKVRKNLGAEAQLYGGRGDDALIGGRGAGDDFIGGSEPGRDVMLGGGGNDFLEGLENLSVERRIDCGGARRRRPNRPQRPQAASVRGGPARLGD